MSVSVIKIGGKLCNEGDDDDDVIEASNYS